MNKARKELIAKGLQEYHEAFMACDKEKLRAFFHPDYQATEGGQTFDFEHRFERAVLAKQRYGIYFINFVGFEIINEHAVLFHTHFYGHDTILDKASERHISAYSEFSGDLVIREVYISSPPLTGDFDAALANVTIEENYKHKLFQLLEHVNFNHISLTLREINCLFHYLIGKSYREIGELLFISNKTVDSHLSNIKIKCGLENTKQLKSYFKILP